MDFDAVTVAPYMGRDSVVPFLQYNDKWVILLGLTSNEGAEDFQMLKVNGQKTYLFEQVFKTASAWGTPDNLMFVAGATRPEWLKKIRRIIPDHFLLVPGLGAQGGDLGEVSMNGLNSQGGLLVNSSRAIIYADVTNKFDQVAREKAAEVKSEMEIYLKKKKII